jgi:hypothetical protein
MKLWSNGFSDGEPIPGDFAFGLPDVASHVIFGPNQNPHLAWSGMPADTRSIAIVVHDTTVPTRPDDVNQEGREVPAALPRADFFHWVLIDISPEVKEIEAGSLSDAVVPHGKDTAGEPGGIRQGLNDYTMWFADDPDMNGDYFGYDGPCPPWNDSLVHHYEFSVFALAVDQLDVPLRFTGQGARDAMAGHILASASLTGTYTLNQRLL